MAGNVFDQFDAKPSGNVFDRFDPAVKKPAGDGQAVSGFKRSFQEVPGLLAGVGAYAADVVGADSTRDNLLSYAKRKSDEVGAAHAGDAQSITDAWDGKVGWLDFLANASGYVAGQALQSVATGGLGALGAKMLAKQGIKEVAEAAAAKAIAAGAGEEAARAASLTAMKAATNQAMTRGGVLGAGAQNFNMELGSIYPDAVDEAKGANNLDAGDKFRVLAAASLAAGVDTAGEAIMASRMFKGSKVGVGMEKPPTLFGSEFAGRAVREVPAGMAREAGTEAIQTGLEHYGAGTPIADEKGLRDIVDSAGVGAVGGLLGGLGASIRRRKQAEAPKADATDVLAAGSIDDATRTAMLAISGPVTKADWEVVDGTLALPGPRAAPTPETLKALPGPDGKPVYMVDAQGNAAVQPAVARTEALNREFAAQQASDAAAELEQSRRLDLGKQTARGDEPIGKIPVGEVTRFDMLPTGDATEVEQIPAGDATEIAPEVIEPTDLLASDQQPYGNKTSAQAKAFATGGGRVVAIPDHFGSGVPGYVVRPITDGRPANTRSTNASDVLRASNVNQPDVPGTAGVAAGAADGRAPSGVGGSGDLGSRTAADRGLLPAAQAPEPSSGAAAPTGSGSQSDKALTPGTAVTLMGSEWTVKDANPSTVILTRTNEGGGTDSRVIRAGTATWQAIQPVQPANISAERVNSTKESEQVALPAAPVQAPSTSGAVAPAAVAPKPKVFKTKQQAQVASKLSGNTQRVKKVSGGFILREASDKELAAAAAAGKRLSRKGAINPDKDSLLTAIAKMGGLAMNEKADTIGEGNNLTAGGHVFTNGGMAIDEMAQQLGEEQGYIPADEMRDGGVRWLRDAIKDEHGGHRQYFSTRGEDWMEKARAEREAQYDDEPLDPLDPFTVDELQESGYISAAPDVQAVTEQMLAEAQELGIDTDTLKEDADSETRGQTDAEFHDHLQAKLRQAIAQTRSDAGGTDTGPARASNQGDSQPAGDQGQEGSREGLTLSAQTPADLQAKADREDAARKADADKQSDLAAAEGKRQRGLEGVEKDRRAAEVLAEREAEKRREVDAAAETFALGQEPPKPVDRKVSTEQASGQRDVFDQPAEPAKPELSTKVPPAVRDRINWALGAMRDVSDSLAWVERARGNGYILAMEWQDQQSKLERPREILAEFRKMAPGNNVDAEAVIKELGGEPDFKRYGTPEEATKPDQATNKESLPVAAAKPARDDTLIELRKRESVLKSLLDCLG